MTDFSHCLRGLVVEQRLSQEQADDILREIKRMERRNARNMGPDSAQRAAVEAYTRAFQTQAARRKQLRHLEILATERVLRASEAHEKGFVAGALAHLVKDIWGEARHSNVEARQDSILGQLHQMFAEGIDAFRPRYSPRGIEQDRMGLQGFIRELYGEDSGNATAKAAARAWTQTTEYTRTRFNAAGGAIRKRADWRVPQTHDRKALQQAGYARWRRTFTARDLATMQEIHGLEAPALEEALKGVYDTIVTGGPRLRETGGRGKALAQRYADKRFLYFADAASWLRYHEDFGAGDIYGLLSGHLKAQARDIALLEVLGPNPAALVQRLSDRARAQERQAPAQGLGHPFSPLDVTRRWMEHPEMLGRVYDLLSGRADTPVNEPVAAFWGGLRHLISTTQLGSAPVAAMADSVFLTKTALWNGLPAGQVMARYLSLLRPKNAEARRFAARSGLIARAWMGKAVSVQRFQDEVVGEGWTAHLADNFHRITGLSAMTQAGRWAFGLEFMGLLAEQKARSFDHLIPALARGLKAYGVTPELWEAARKAEVLTFEGVDFMNPAQMILSEDARRAEAGRRLHEMILTETDFAIPEPDARVRAMATFGTPRGSFLGEVARSTMMYKSFPLTVMTTHMMQGLAQGGMTRRLYFMGLLAGLTVMGGFSLQIGQVLAGKDPRDATTPSFWSEAFSRGGGAGLYGDLLDKAAEAAQAPRTGRGLAALGGPVGGFLADTAHTLLAPPLRAMAGEDARFGAEAYRFAKRYNPGSSIWYTKLAFDRSFMRMLRLWADPDHARGFRALERWTRRHHGQDYYWRPGKAAPERLPDFFAFRGDD